MSSMALAGTRVNWSAVNQASRQIDLAKADLRRAAADARRQVESTAEYIEAVAALRQAHIDHHRAAQKVSESVEASREYIVLDLKLQSAVAEVDRLHNKSPRDDRATFAAAAVVLAIRAEMTELRATALADDANVQAAHYAVIDAGMKLRLLREDAKSRVTQSPAWQAARQQLNAARKQYAAAG